MSIARRGKQWRTEGCLYDLWKFPQLAEDARKDQGLMAPLRRQVRENPEGAEREIQRLREARTHMTRAIRLLEELLGEVEA